MNYLAEAATVLLIKFWWSILKFQDVRKRF